MAGQRLDKLLKKYFRAASSGFLYKMLRKKNITLCGKKATGQEIVQASDTIEVYFSDETFEKMKGEDASRRRFDGIKTPSRASAPLSILYEDADIIVASKPAGILSQGSDTRVSQTDARREATPSMNDLLLAYMKEKGELQPEDYRLFHPSIANRLDRNTSGIILFGKTLKGSQFLAKELSSRKLKKLYRCIACGRLEGEAILEGWIKKDPTSNQSILVDAPGSGTQGAQPIRTGYRSLACTDHLSHLELTLYTGRSHQIRVQLAALGHPVLLDPKYGNAGMNQEIKSRFPVRFQMLHAYAVTFSDGRQFVSPEPKVYQKILEEY